MDWKTILIVLTIITSCLAAPATNNEKGDEILCEVCHVMVKDFGSMIGANTTEAEVQNILDSICNRLASSRDVCSEYVHKYLPNLFEKISGNLDPQTVCKLLEVCPNITNNSMREPISDLRLGEASKEAIEEIENVDTKKIENKKVQANNNTCNLCQFVIQYLDAELTVNSTNMEVNATLLRVCKEFDSLSPIIGDLCRQIEPQIMDRVNKGLIDSQKACEFVKLCNPTNVKPPPPPPPPRSDVLTVKSTSALQRVLEKNKKGKPVVWKHEIDASPATCQICEFVIQIIDATVANNNSEPAINSTIYKSCDALNGLVPALGSLCYGVAPNVLKAIEAGVDPEKACTAVKLCNETSRVISLEDVNCDVCKAILREVMGKSGDQVCDTMQGICVEPGKKVHRPKPALYNDIDTILEDEPEPVMEEEEENYVEPKQKQIIEEEEENYVEPNQKHTKEDEEEKPEIDASPATCQICEFVIQIIDATVANNNSEPAINSTIYKACDALNGLVPALGSLCYGVAPNVLKAIEAGVDPEKACTAVRLCNETSRVISLAGVDCDGCKVILREVMGKSGDQVCDTMQGICVEPGKKVHRSKPALYKTVDTVLEEEPVMEEEEENYIEPKQNQIKEDEEETPEANPIECAVCKFLAEELQQVMLNNKTEVTLNTTILGLCNDLPDNIKSYCIYIAPTVLNLLLVETNIDPLKLCTALKLCSADMEEESLPIEETFKEETKIEANPLECAICKIVVEELEKRVITNKTDAAINSTVYQLCDELPNSVKTFCLSVAPNIVTFIVREANADPASVCKDLTVCDAVQAKEPIPKEVLDMVEHSKPIEEVEARLPNKSYSAINSTVFQLCSNMPEQFSALCIGLAPRIVDFLAHEANSTPSAVCASINLCDNSSSYPIAEKEIMFDLEKRIRVEDDTCDLCKLVVNLIDQYLGSNKTAQAINSTVYNFCNASFIPADVKLLCLGLAPELVKDIETGFDANKACAAVSLCNSTYLNEEPLEIALLNALDNVVKSNNNDGSEECEICEFIAVLVDELLLENVTKDFLNGTLYGFCSAVEIPEIKQFCLQLVPMLLKEIETDWNVTVVCDRVGLCSVNGTYSDKVLHKKETLLHSLVTTPDRKGGEIECEVCEAVVSLLDEIIKTNSSKEYINSTLFEICSIFKIPDVGQICRELAPKLLHELELNWNATYICDRLRICSMNGTHSKRLSLEKEESNFSSLDKIVTSTTYGGILECQVCNFVVTIVDEIVRTNSSKDYINATLFEMCALIENRGIQQFCRDLAPKLLQELESGWNATYICDRFRLCSNSSYSGTIKQRKEQIKLNSLDSSLLSHKDGGELECQICEFVVSLVDEVMLTNNSKEYINSTLFEICSTISIPEINKICRELAPKLLLELESGWNVTYVCGRLRFCVNSTSSSGNATPIVLDRSVSNVMLGRAAPEIDPEDDVGCQICVLAVQFIDKYIGRNSSVDVINATVYNMCNSLPDDLKAACTVFAPTIVKAASGGFSPEKACDDLKLCHNGTLTAVKKMQDAFTDILTNEYSNEENTICEVCKLVARNINNIVGQNKTKAEINNTLETICEKVPADLKYFCELLKPVFIKDFEDGLDPLKACGEVKLCTNGTNIEEIQDITPVKNSPSVEVDARCELCKFFMNLIGEEIGKNTSIATINETLLAACNMVPDNFKAICAGIVPTIIATVENGIDPEQVCKAAEYCANNTAAVHALTCKTCHGIVELVNPSGYSQHVADSKCYMFCPRRQRRSVGSQLVKTLLKNSNEKPTLESGETWDCTVCEFLSQTANVLIRDNQTEETVEKTLMNLCKYLPSPYDKKCTSSAHEIIHEIEQGFDARMVCNKVTGDKCDNASSLVDEFFESLGNSSDLECVACKKVLGAIVKELGRDFNQTRAYIADACNRLPEPTSTACKGLIDTDGGKIIDKIINQLLQPEKVCQFAKLCPVNWE